MIMFQCLSELLFLSRHKLSGKGVSGVRRTHVTQSEYLYHPVLQGNMRVLQAPLGRVIVGADVCHVQLIHRKTERISTHNHFVF